jgi:hypothetical protein
VLSSNGFAVCSLIVKTSYRFLVNRLLRITKQRSFRPVVECGKLAMSWSKQKLLKIQFPQCDGAICFAPVLCGYVRTMSTAPLITIFVRNSEDCKHKGDDSRNAVDAGSISDGRKTASNSGAKQEPALGRRRRKSSVTWRTSSPDALLSAEVRDA